MGYKPSASLNTNSLATSLSMPTLSSNNYDQTQKLIFDGGQIQCEPASPTLFHNRLNNVHIADNAPLASHILPGRAFSMQGGGINIPQLRKLHLDGYGYSGFAVNNDGIGGVAHTHIGGAINPSNDQTHWTSSDNLNCY